MEQKKFDVNSFIGMLLLGAILLWWMSTREQEELPNTDNTESVTDSIKKENFTDNTKTVINDVKNDSLKNIAIQNKLGAFAMSAIQGT